jgi:hypothetical protein
MELHVLNGEHLKQYFLENQLEENHSIISFNECLMDGPLETDIFNSTFFDKRNAFLTQYFNLPSDTYKEHTVNELMPLLDHHKYESIYLWFDEDMACQIHLLTVLAYLQKNGYNGNIIIKLIKQDFHLYPTNQILLKEIEIYSSDDFHELYQNILVKENFDKLNDEKHKALFERYSFLKYGLALFREYRMNNNVIEQFIIENKKLNKRPLIKLLLSHFKEFGLTDLQYSIMIENRNQ